MVIMSLRGVCFSYGANMLLDNAYLNIKSREKICLIGRNGVGKTTLMGIINEDVDPDTGKVWKSNSIQTGYLIQSIPPQIKGDAFQVICSGFGETGKAISTYLSMERNDSNRNTFSEVSQKRLRRIFENEEGWHLQRKVEGLISQMGIEKDVPVSNFSAGMQRRVLLARAIVADPDLLLLDEPTNHMDLDFIFWLERFLMKFKKTLLFTTHDRAMIKSIATRIVEIDKGSLSSWECGYDDYLKLKKHNLSFEKRQERCFEKKILIEENWIKSGIKARRTRNEGRVRALKKMRKEHSKYQNKALKAKLQIDECDPGGKLVIEAKDISFNYNANLVIKNLSCKISRGDRLGIVGSNGCGKSTLIRLLLREIKPNFGLVRHGERIKAAYFDQCRIQIDGNKTASDNVFDGNNVLEVDGKKRYSVGYLKDFLFSSDRVSLPARMLSGGEKNRLLLAKLFAKPSNVLVLDEPTNDLDLETLELLEKLLIDYKGTILLVSHDRNFLENVITNVLVFKDNGTIETFIGASYQWYDGQFEVKKSVETKAKTENKKSKKTILTKRKISYIHKRELKTLPDEIESLEQRELEIYKLLSQPDFYKQSSNYIVKKQKELYEIKESIKIAYLRWEALETLV